MKFWNNYKPVKIGKPRSFESPQDLWEKACEYFEHCVNNPIETEDFIKSGHKAGNKITLNKAIPFTIAGLCIYLGVNTKYFNDFNDMIKEKNADGADEELSLYSEVICAIRDVIWTQKFNGAAVGLFQHQLIAMELGMAQKVDQKVDISDAVQEVFMLNGKEIRFGQTVKD